jgi:hypothetical protein
MAAFIQALKKPVFYGQEDKSMEISLKLLFRFSCNHCCHEWLISDAMNLRDNYILSIAQIETGEQGSVNDPHGSVDLCSQIQAAPTRGAVS